MNIDKLLQNLKACDGAQEWAKGKSWKEIYTTCHRGDWLLWLFKKTAAVNDENLKLLTRAKAHCALTVKHLMRDIRSINACEVALKFADGLATKKELIVAADAAYDAYVYAYAAHAAYAGAGAAAGAAAYAAYDGVAAGADDAAAGAAAFAGAARIKNQLKTADICRLHLPMQVWNIGNNKILLNK